MKIKLLVLDVDGTLTDGKIYMGAGGELFKTFNIKDGCGIHDILPRYGIQTAIITARVSAIVENRCKELGIDLLFQGMRDKAACLQRLLDELQIHKDEVAYMGDDLLDLPCIALCGLSGCPQDAAAEVRQAVTFPCTSKGGDGAVREFIEWMIRLPENGKELE